MDITLIGMPGSGKSTVGRLLAGMLGWDHLDVDPLITAACAQTSLQAVLDSLGPDAFLDKEAEIIAGLSCDHTVLSPGGSAVLREKGALRLKELGPVVYLDLPCPVLEKRLWNLSSRGVPLAPGQTLRDLYEQRLPYYQKYADLTIQADLPRPQDTAAAILRALEL